MDSLDGATILALRRALKRINQELDQYWELNDELIRKTGKTELKQEDPEFLEVAKKLFEAQQAEVELGITPCLTVEDCRKLKLTVGEVDTIENLGILKEGTDG